VSRKPAVIKTVLGSCISVCLWDGSLKIGGINHYMYPYWDGDGLATPQYGNVAMKSLLDAMLLAGSRQDRLIAKVFGGAMLLGGENPALHVGKRNLEVCKTYLRRFNIRVAAEDTGGTRGRSLLFFTGTGDVLLKRHKQKKADMDAVIPKINPAAHRLIPGEAGSLSG